MLQLFCYVKDFCEIFIYYYIVRINYNLMRVYLEYVNYNNVNIYILYTTKYLKLILSFKYLKSVN